MGATGCPTRQPTSVDLSLDRGTGPSKTSKQKYVVLRSQNRTYIVVRRWVGLTAEPGQDLVGGLGLGEGLAVLVPALAEPADGGGEILDA